MPLPDSELLRTFAREADEAAFAELVKRRIDFVYAAALRQVAGDAHCAQDVTQEVFIKLARHAAALGRHPALLGWLCTTTRHAAVDAIRREQRRRARETQATTMQAIDRDEPTDWAQLQPVLDEALTSLPERDREIVLARFFARQPFAEIARDLGISENAAQHRADRALDKLRTALSRRRITSTSAALAVLLANQPSVAAPAALAAAVTQSAVSGVGATVAVGGAGFFAFMSTTKIVLGAAGVVTALSFASLYLGAKSAGDAESALAASLQRETTLTARVQELEKRVEAETQRSVVAERRNTELLATARQPDPTPAPAPAPAAAETETITSDFVTKRFREAQRLVFSGDAAEALRELIWCYDIGFPKVGLTGPVRTSSLGLFGRLGERHPPALAWLRERRDQAKPRVLADERDRDSVAEYSSMNRALNDHADSIALLDSLPPNDRRRTTIAGSAFEYLVDAQRYQDAVRGKSMALMMSSFERQKESTSEWESFVTDTARNIEVLAGAGELANARELATRLLKVDPSAATRATVQRHAKRAGQPTLLTPEPAIP
jgi:RNA polymerase sigma factor (sigma-70 family)